VSTCDTTPMTYVAIHPDGDRTFIHTPGANSTFGLKDLDMERLLDADYLLYQDLFVLPSMDGEPAAKLLAEAKKRGVTTFLDECFGNGPKRETIELMLPFCDYVMPSIDDLRTIYPGASDEELISRLLEKGARVVVLKMGSHGCVVAQGNTRTHVPAFPAKVVDTTGAGDCWDAGFIAGLSQGEDVISAARVGNACAAFCIEAVGGSTGVPKYDLVGQRASAVREPQASCPG
jgi:sugar/nucleoside kinase (ribokinase family)